MSRFLPTLATDRPEALACQPGQWIDYRGALGRFAGRSPAGVVYIAWTRAAKGRRWRDFRAVARGAGA